MVGNRLTPDVNKGRKEDEIFHLAWFGLPSHNRERGNKMRRVVSVLALLFLIVSVAYPCGGKYLARSRLCNKRPAVRPAAILVLNNQNLQAHAKSLKSTLKHFGHKVKTVKDFDEFATALKSGKKYDIVIADISTMGALVRQLNALSSDVVPVPLTFKNSKADSLKAKQYEYVVELSAKPREIDKKIDKKIEKALKLKGKALKPKTQKVG